MTFQSNPQAIPFGVAVAISAALALFAWRRRAMPAAPSFALMMIGEAVWALGEALELVVVDLPVKIVGYDIRVVGAMTTIVGLFAFVLRFTGRDYWLHRRRFAAIAAPAIALCLLAWSNPWHHRFWSAIWPEQWGGYVLAMHTYGPGFWLALLYCYGISAISTALLIHAVLRSVGIYRDQATIMLFGVLLPWLVNIIDMTRVFGAIQVDAVAISFAVTGLAFVPALFRYRLLDLTPVAWAVVVRGMDDPVVVIDPLGRIVELNPAAGQMVDPRNLQIIGSKASQAFQNWPALAKRLDRIEEHSETTFEIDGPEHAGPSSYDARISRFGDAARQLGWVLVLRDVTAHKRAEEERVRMLGEQAARAEAEAASRAKDRFLATLSHELRTPLTPVLATVTAALDDHATSASVRTLLEMIRRNVVLETRLIDDLLDLSRIRQGKLRLECTIIDAHELIKEVIEIFQDEFRTARLQLQTDLAARRRHALADPLRLQQVLWNLIKNAIKFTPAGGTVTVRSRNDGLPENGDSQDTTGSRLLLEVSDTGIGIEEHVLPRIFDSFEQGKSGWTSRHGGLGLGLAISRSIAEQHGGQLVAASAGSGCGATFTLELPTVLAPSAASPMPRAPLASAAADATPQESLRILLVDDNSDTLNSLSRLLTRRGHVVLTASRVTDAREIASQTSLDLLISDIELADGSGLELMWHLRSRHDLAGIALSGFGSSEDVELCRAAGFALHLTKPIDFRSLEQAIQQLAARRGQGSLVHGQV